MRVKISGSAGPHKAGTMGTAGTAPDFPHTCARYNKVENNTSDDTDEEEQLTEGSDPYSPLPTFPQNYVCRNCWRESSPSVKIPNSVMYCSWERLPYWVPPSHIVRCQYGRKWQAPVCRLSSWPRLPREKAR